MRYSSEAAAAAGGAGSSLSSLSTTTSTAVSSGSIASSQDQVAAAKLKGFEGDSCSDCGNFTLVRNGTCMKCVTCGSTSGCS